MISEVRQNDSAGGHNCAGESGPVITLHTDWHGHSGNSQQSHLDVIAG